MWNEAVEDTYQQPTVKLKQCAACRGELFETHDFCRWCGSSQVEAVAGETALASNELNTNRLTVDLCPAGPAGAMREATPVTDASLYHQVSEPLVKAITATMSARATANLNNRCTRRLILALISVPVWMILVLLSPLDAYLASKALLRQSESSPL